MKPTLSKGSNTMNCTICHKPITLNPSAAERAKRFGGKASDYTRLFTTHSDCAIEEYRKGTSTLIKRTIDAINNQPDFR